MQNSALYVFVYLLTTITTILDSCILKERLSRLPVSSYRIDKYCFEFCNTNYFKENTEKLVLMYFFMKML